MGGAVSERRTAQPLVFGGGMRKKLLALLASVFAGAGLSAYNPPAGGQNVLRLTEPQLLTGAASAAGGGIFGVTPASVINNPALTAWEQRITLDGAGTFFLGKDGDDDNKIGGAAECGLLVPSRWCVSTFLFQGIWTEFIDMPVGNSVNLTAALSKDISDQVSVGIAGTLGFLYGSVTKSDCSAVVSAGAYYDFGDLFFMKGLRFGGSVGNIGKVYTKSRAPGIKGGEADSWPGICTLRTGAAASFVRRPDFELGASFDLSYPKFQNVVVDTGLQLQVKDFLKVSSSWEFDAREFFERSRNLLPSVGVGFKFRFSSSEDSYLARKGWQQSDMTVSSAARLMYGNVHALSAGVLMNLGLADTKAPEIILWGEE